MLRNAIAIITGIFTAVAIIFIIGLFSGFLVFSDASIPRSQEIASEVLLVIGCVIGSFLGGYVTAIISKKNAIACTTINSFILLALYLLIYNFDLSNTEAYEKICALVVPLFTILSGYIFDKRKKSA